MHNPGRESIYLIQQYRLKYGGQKTHKANHEDNRYIIDDYTVTIEKQTNAGKYTITVNGIGNYSATSSDTWEIGRANMGELTIEGIESKIYDGKAEEYVYTMPLSLDEFTDVGRIDGFPHPVHVRILILDGDVGQNRIGEDEALLHDDAALRTPVTVAVAGQVSPAQKDLARDRRVETEKHFQQCCR